MFKDVLQEILANVVLERKEIGQEEEDRHVAQFLEWINSLRNCGLLKFFGTTRLRAKMELLPYMISLRDAYWEIFIIKYQELELEEIYIYFLM